MLGKSEKNLLDLVPARSPHMTWSRGPEGSLQVRIPRDGRLERLVRRVKRTPAVFTVTLESYGAFVWEHIDGYRTVEEIGRKLRDVHGENAEPLYPRLVQFLSTLKNNRMITLV